MCRPQASFRPAVCVAGVADEHPFQSPEQDGSRNRSLQSDTALQQGAGKSHMPDIPLGDFIVFAQDAPAYCTLLTARGCANILRSGLADFKIRLSNVQNE
jgi:hypothetical protein